MSTLSASQQGVDRHRKRARIPKENGVRARGSVSFTVTFKRTLTPKTHDQVITFELILRARGGEVARIPIEITIEGVDV